MPSSPKMPLAQLFTVWGGNILSKLMMFLATIWLANLLREEGFGIFSTGFAAVNYLSLALFTGLDTLVTRQSAALPEGQVWPYAQGLFRLRRRLTNLLMLAIALGVWLFGLKSGQLGLTLLAFGLSFLPQAVYSVNLFYGREWPGPVCAYFIGGRVLYLALIYLLVARGQGTPAMAALCFTLAIAAENLFLYFLLRSRYAGSADRQAPCPPIAWGPALLLTLLTALFALHENAPQILVYFLKGEREAGLYASAFRLIYTAVTFANLGGFVFLARFTRQQQEPGKLDAAYARTRRLAFLFGLLAAAAGYFLAPWVYGFLFREAYAGGVRIFQAGVLQMALVPARVLAFQYLVASGRGRRLLGPVLLGVLASLGLSWFMISRHGALGASQGLVFGELVITGLLLLLSRKRRPQ